MTENWKEELVDQEEFAFPPDPADDFDWAPATQEVAGNMSDLPLETWQNQTTSRREFLRGVVCSGVAVSSASYLWAGNSSEARAAVRGVERLVTLNINGRNRRVDVAPNETLAHTIRYRLGSVSYTHLTLPTKA